jgi:PTS system nitrogen regulatory IIA component
MNRIVKLLPASNILLDVEVSSKKRMFEQVGLLFENNRIARSCLRQPVRTRAARFHRPRPERRSRTAGSSRKTDRRVPAVEGPVAFSRARQPPVNLPVLLVPEQATEQHSRSSELAQMFSDRELRSRLAAATDAATLHEQISAWQPYVPDSHAPNQRRASV